MSGDVEEAILEMYLSGISVRKIAGVTEALSRVRIGKDAVSCIASRLEEQSRKDGGSVLWRRRNIPTSTWRRHLPEGPLGGEGHEHMALLACVGVDEEGFREVLAVEVAGSEKGAAYTPRCFGDSSTGAFQECKTGG